MNKSEINRRIEEVIRTDATVADEADFMLTHMPFKKLADYRQGFYAGKINNLIKDEDYEDALRFDEQSVFDDLVEREDNHELFMIIGRNGSGKSHLIRWLYYQLQKNIKKSSNKSEQIIFIPRAHNNLKEVFKSILDKKILSDDRIEHYMTRINGGVSNAGEEELKDIIYSHLSIIVKHNDKENELSTPQRLKLVDFMSDDAVKEHYFMMQNGPIENIYNALTTNSGGVAGKDPFQEVMFVKNTMDITAVLRNAKHQAKSEVLKFANELTRETELRGKVIKYLNSIVGMVIERSSSISGTDLQALFQEMRKELKSEGKKLTLFIEDINVYKGIDSALVEILIEPHTVENGLCRLKSVVGSTDRYFDDYFSTSLRDRMTRKIVILDKTLLEDKTKMIEFAARYINAVHISKKEVEEWYNSESEEPPLWSEPHRFSRVEIDGRIYSIFPFNENAIENLFDSLNESARSPRGFLKCIIKPVVTIWNSSEEKLIDSKQLLLSNEGLTRINGFRENVDQQAFAANRYADGSRREFLYQVWGNRTFRPYEGGLLGGVTDEVLEDFKVENAGKKGEKPGPDPEPPVVIPPQPPQPVVNPHYLSRLKAIQDWYTGVNKEYVSHKDARELLSAFILKNINWELEGIPYTFAKEFIGKIQNIDIEGQTAPGTGKIKIKRDEQSGQMLIALLTQNNNPKDLKNSWNFEEGPEQEIFAKTWLLLNKKRILNVVREELFKEQAVEQMVVDAKVAKLISLGMIDTWETERMLDSVVRGDVIDAHITLHRTNDKWTNISSYFTNKSAIIRSVFDAFYINTVGVTRPDSTVVKYIIIDALDLMRRIDQAKINLTSRLKENIIQCADERISEANNAVVFFKQNIGDCTADILSFSKKELHSFAEWLGNDPTEVSIRKTIDNMVSYLKFIKTEVGFNYPPDMIEILTDIESVRAINGFLKDMRMLGSATQSFELQVLCGTLNTETIKKYSNAFTRFEEYMDEKTEFFSGKIDLSLNKKISTVENEIKETIDGCISA